MLRESPQLDNPPFHADTNTTINNDSHALADLLTLAIRGGSPRLTGATSMVKTQKLKSGANHKE